MSRDERDTLRRMIDRRMRELLDLTHQRSGFCAGCGCEYDTFTAGCKTCHHRRERRKMYDVHRAKVTAARTERRRRARMRRALA